MSMLIKSETSTGPGFGKSPGERSMEEMIKASIVVVDKHSGPTSHQISAWVKDIFHVKKTGHMGTLDPAVTGVLPVALGNAVKAMPLFAGLKKEYVGVMHVHKEVPEDALRKTIAERFLGKIRQTPPVKSAVARREREREIYSFDILELDGKDVLFKVECEAGTYIRKLCSDIGLALGTGAHMSELRRTKAGNFTEEQSRSLMEIKDAYEFWKEGDESRLKKILMPIESALGHAKKVFVKDSAVASLMNGSPLYANGIVRLDDGIVEGENVCMLSLKGEMVALGIARMDSRKMQKKDRGVAIRTDRVIVGRDTYAESATHATGL